MAKKKEAPTYTSLIGQTVKQAMTKVSKIDSRISTIRVVNKDGSPCMGTADARPNRLNVAIVDNLITEVRGIG